MPRRYSPPSRIIRGVEVLAAVAVLISTWATVVGAVAAYPRWLYLGAVTVPTLVVAPTVLAIVVFGRWVRTRRTSAGGNRTRQMLATGAGLTLVSSGYAVWTLNVSTPGVFWAGFLPLIAGVLLAGGVLLGHATRVRQQLSVKSSRST